MNKRKELYEKKRQESGWLQFFGGVSRERKRYIFIWRRFVFYYHTGLPNTIHKTLIFISRRIQEFIMFSHSQCY